MPDTVISALQILTHVFLLENYVLGTVIITAIL